MDPNETRRLMVEKARQLLQTLEARHEAAVDSDDEITAYELAQHVLDLDGWLNKGGFPPAAWKHHA